MKQTYLTSQRSLSRKIKEAAIAIRLSRDESKNEILLNYLNTIYWGRGAYGIQAAAQAYFGRNANQLNLAEASLLAGLIREPEYADPARNPTLARPTRPTPLRAMAPRPQDHQTLKPSAVEARAFLSRYVISAGCLEWGDGNIAFECQRAISSPAAARAAVRQIRPADG